ncbi:hypothetical protein ACEQ6A_08810 [Rhizobium brockwellii]|uniref:hypothetical protein n=1 Tax=Rhizobium brockwellii TaxID=3019932 RepID=UPI003F97992F
MNTDRRTILKGAGAATIVALVPAVAADPAPALAANIARLQAAKTSIDETQRRLAAVRYPLPEGMTAEFFRELAADTRRCLESRTLTAFQRDRFALDAEIFERMASQLEPFEALETELWARDRDIMVLHGRAA